MNSVRAFYRNKKVLVTGHTGFKGTWLSRMLLYCGAEVSGLSLPPDGSERLFLSTGSDKDVRGIYADVRDAEVVRETVEKVSPDVVFHLAAQPIVSRGYAEPLLTYSTNVLGTLHLLEALRVTGSAASFVNVTTDKVYEKKDDGSRFTEDDRLNGFDPYSNSKSCSELITQTYNRSFFSSNQNGAPAVSSVRAGNVIGGGDFSADRILPDCMRAFRENRPVVLRHPESVRPYQYVPDALFAYLTVAAVQARDPSKAGAYNIGAGGNGTCTTKKLAEYAAAAWGGAEISCPELPEGFHETGVLTLDCSKFSGVFGKKPETDLRLAVKKTVFWYKSFFAGADARALTDGQIADYFRENGI